MVALTGFEPVMIGSEPTALPLGYRAISIYYFNTKIIGCKQIM